MLNIPWSKKLNDNKASHDFDYFHEQRSKHSLGPLLLAAASLEASFSWISQGSYCHKKPSETIMSLSLLLSNFSRKSLKCLNCFPTTEYLIILKNCMTNTEYNFSTWHNNSTDTTVWILFPHKNKLITMFTVCTHTCSLCTHTHQWKNKIDAS